VRKDRVKISNIERAVESTEWRELSLLSIGYQVLLERVFGGDFAGLLEWSRVQDVAASQMKRRNVRHGLKSNVRSVPLLQRPPVRRSRLIRA
jgi:hypothetical protein